MVSSNLCRLVQRRLLSTAKPSSTSTSTSGVKQVTRSNFAEALDEIKPLISASQYVAVSLTNSGSYASTWHKVSAFDTPETAYLKSKFAADRFQILQLAVCPFSVSASKLTAHPYNFNLFPRDDLRLRMPCYSFSCQSSSLRSMARQGFDFNTCIYDGISYLSRDQESAARILLGSPVPAMNISESDSAPSVADSIFIERMRSRVRHWRDAYSDSSNDKDDVLVKSLRKILAGSEEYKSRPSISIDVCSERQAQLIVKMVLRFADDMVPLLKQAKGVTQAVRVVLTRSKEDKNLLLMEIDELEVERNEKARGFREVIDFISDSQKPVVSHNSLDDLTFIHAKLLAPLPASIDDFMSSLRLAFPQVIDINLLMKAISPKRRGTNLRVAMGHLNNHFFAPVDLEIPDQAMFEEDKIHGHAVVRISQLFAKLCHILKVTPNTDRGPDVDVTLKTEPFANMFRQYTSDTECQEPNDGEVRIWSNNTRKIKCENVIFLWGFRDHITAGMLKSLLQESHELFAAEFDVRLVEKSCAIVVFWQPGLSDAFLELMNKVGDNTGVLAEMVSEGLRAAGYETYNRVCRLGLWEASLGEALDKALDASSSAEYDSTLMSGNSHHHGEWFIDFDDL